MGNKIARQIWQETSGVCSNQMHEIVPSAVLASEICMTSAEHSRHSGLMLGMQPLSDGLQALILRMILMAQVVGEFDTSALDSIYMNLFAAGCCWGSLWFSGRSSGWPAGSNQPADVQEITRFQLVTPSSSDHEWPSHTGTKGASTGNPSHYGSNAYCCSMCSLVAYG